MKKISLLLLSICCFSTFLTAQTADIEAVKSVSEKDGLFWTGYNACNYEQMAAYIADDVEFYHDKGGIVLGKTDLVDSIKKNLCGKPNFRTRREAVPETVRIYLLKNGKTIYGAIVSGEHYFFNSYDGKPEIREGLAKFMNMWLLKNKDWKMSRILSYDHGAAPPENKK